MANKKKKCKHCKQYHEAAQGIQVPAGFFCSIEHAKDFAQERSSKVRDRMKAKARIEAKKEIRKRKEDLKPLSKLLSEAQSAVNKYVRLRDRNLGCVSCDKPATWHGQWHASHFHPRGRSSRLRFNLLNIHKSCSVCNAHLSGNLLNYEPELIRRIGIDRFKWMESVANEPTRYDPEYLRRLKKVFLKRCRMIERRIEKGS